MTPTIITTLEKALGSQKVLSGEDVKERFHHIWRMNEALQAKALVFPSTKEEVSAILKICHAANQPVVVHGGLTNLVGSTVTNKEEIVISMERMNGIEEVDEKSRTITVQAGVILENINIAIHEKGLLFPLTFGAKGSAQIGGVISTNAGGLRVFRFGMTRNLVLGLEAVLADGTIVSSMKKIIKDNSAYDVKQLFIGSEGTLGVITRAILKLTEAPKSRNSAFVAFNDYEKVIDFLRYMDGGLAGLLSGYELIWKSSYETMTSSPVVVGPPLPTNYKYYVLLESLGSDPEKDQTKFQELLEKAFEKELILDAAIAHGEADLEWFWKIREDVSVLKNACNNDQHFDISLPIPLIGNVVDQIVDRLFQVPGVEAVFPFGHVADGNIHFIVGKKEQSDALINQINDIVYAPLKAIGGSVSAEHGIGLHKKSYLHLCRTEEEIQLMRTLKQTLDPKAILNRGKVL